MTVKPMYDMAMNAINEIDVILDSQEDTASAGKRALLNSFVSANEEKWSPIVDQLVAKFNELTPEELAGVYTGITNGLNSQFKTVVTEFVDAEVASSKSAPVEKISDEDLKTHQTNRSLLFKQLKQIVELAKQFGEGDYEMPKKRTGTKGKRGPRHFSLFVWSINGTDLDEDTTFIDVAKANGYAKAVDLRKAMTDAGCDLKSTAVTFELPNGDVLEGEIPAGSAVEDDSDSDESDDE